MNFKMQRPIPAIADSIPLFGFQHGEAHVIVNDERIITKLVFGIFQHPTNEDMALICSLATKTNRIIITPYVISEQCLGFYSLVRFDEITGKISRLHPKIEREELIGVYGTSIFSLKAYEPKPLTKNDLTTILDQTRDRLNARINDESIDNDTMIQGCFTRLAKNGLSHFKIWESEGVTLISFVVLETYVQYSFKWGTWAYYRIRNFKH